MREAIEDVLKFVKLTIGYPSLKEKPVVLVGYLAQTLEECLGFLGIMTVFNNFHIIPIHRELTKKLRNLVVYPLAKEATKFDEDIYVIDRWFPCHTDSNDKTKDVYLLTLVNDSFYRLEQDGKTYPLNQGYMIKFDGTVDHALIQIGLKKPRRFAAIIWDVLKGEDSIKIYYEMAHRVLDLEQHGILRK